MPCRITYGLEHLQTGNSDTLRSSIHPSILLALVAPLGASAGVEENTDEEQVDQASAALGVVDFLGPRGEELGNAIPATHAEVLVPAVARDAGERSVVVPLEAVLADFRVIRIPIAQVQRRGT